MSGYDEWLTPGQVIGIVLTMVLIGLLSYWLVFGPAIQQGAYP